jgi:cyclic pyranopterin phosphate synthase
MAAVSPNFATADHAPGPKPPVETTPVPAARLTDGLGRVIHDLRVSITDRCNYKCVYCRTGELGAQFPELGIDEYLRLIGIFVSLGITKVRLTGGEPLLRPGIVKLVQELARLHTPNGEPLDLALTTNGHLLDGLAEPLKAAGLRRVTVSMDAVDAPTFERITRVPGSFSAVLAGIRAARAAGLEPLKINCVLLRGFNDDQIEGFAHFARQEGVVVRFIEFMPLEEGRLWTPEIVVPLAEIVERIGRVLPLVKLEPREASETARRYGFEDGIRRDRHHRPGEPGLLRSVQPGAADLRRQDPHLPVFPGGARPVWTPARGRERCGTGRLHCARGEGQGAAPSYRRAGIPEAFPFDGAYWRLTESTRSAHNLIYLPLQCNPDASLFPALRPEPWCGRIADRLIAQRR